MLGSQAAAQALPKQGFRIEWVDGALITELYPGAQFQTVRLYTRLIEQLTAPTAADPLSNTGQFAGSSNPAQAMAVAGAASGIATPTGCTIEGSKEPADAGVNEDKPEWLSEAITRWRAEGGVTFSENTWEFSYAPSFRQFLELLGDTRRDIVNADGTLTPSQLDIRLADLTRRHFVQLHEQMKLIPHRQGKRNDGLEAKEMIRRAAAGRLKPQSADNVAKKYRHPLPLVRFLKKKGWISEALLDEFHVQLKAADARALLVKKRSKKGKAGAVSLTGEELRKTYESKEYLDGAIKCDWKYWVDPIRLYAAARVGEVSQLLTTDIITICGVPCFSFVDDSPEVDGDDEETNGAVSKANTVEEYRRLKNAASRRVIPIAPQLLKMGLLDLLRRRQEALHNVPGPLFPGLNWQPKSGYGRRPSEHTLDLLKTAGVWQKRRKVGHSLRATCAQHLGKLGLRLEEIQRYLGHSTETELEDAYSKTDDGPAYPVQRVAKQLEELDFGVSFPTWAEVLKLRAERAREQQLSRKNGHARLRLAELAARDPRPDTTPFTNQEA